VKLGLIFRGEFVISSANAFKWLAKFGGIDGLLVKRMNELEQENCCLKKSYAGERLKAKIDKDIIAELKWNMV